jgi:hypothetical protein
MVTSSETLDEWELSLCLPLSLLINFSLFQYLLTQYHQRRRELRGFTLLLCAFCGFVLLVPFANSNAQVVEHFGVVSESCSILTFLLQLTIVGRDINRKIRIRSLLYLTYASEIFILMGLLVALLNLLAVAYPPLAPPILDTMAGIAKKVALIFIFFSRFYFLLAARGATFLLQTKKREMVAYVLFITYEYPFMALEASTGLSWRNVEALWLRFTIFLCIAINLHEKLRTSSAKSGNGGGGASASRAADRESSAGKLGAGGKATAVVPVISSKSGTLLREESKRRATESNPPVRQRLPPLRIK